MLFINISNHPSDHLKEIIKKTIKKKRITIYALSKATGTKKETLYRWLNGHQKSIKDEDGQRLRKWLEEGKDQ